MILSICRVLQSLTTALECFKNMLCCYQIGWICVLLCEVKWARVGWMGRELVFESIKNDSILKIHV